MPHPHQCQNYQYPWQGRPPIELALLGAANKSCKTGSQTLKDRNQDAYGSVFWGLKLVTLPVLGTRPNPRGAGVPPFLPLLLPYPFTSSSFALYYFFLFSFSYLLSFFIVHPIPFYQNRPIPFPGWRSQEVMEPGYSLFCVMIVLSVLLS